MSRRKKLAPPAWTPNQIVAHNIAKARLLRGLTQDQAAEACAPYLGARLSPASWSALERSVDGGRIREITADELIGFARGFALPIGFFLTPPSVWDGHVVAAPDAGPDGLEPIELFDVVIGTTESLAEWEQYLLSWPSPESRVRIQPDGTMENLGRVQPDVHPRLAGPAALHAQLLLRQQFGDLDRARDVLHRLTATLDLLDDTAPDDTR
ncbi:MAG: helix-turn-helix transcriptional regulator [Acidimicrobiales bacterium]